MLLVFPGLFVLMLCLVFVCAPFVHGSEVLKKLPVVFVALSALAIPSRVAAQITSPDQNMPFAPLPRQAAETATPAETSSGNGYDRPVSWKLLYRNVLADQKQIWFFPAKLIRGQDLVPTAVVLGTTAGLVFADPSEAAYFRRTTTFDGFRHIMNGNATAIGMGAIPASLYAIGLIRKDSKMQHTALLAGEALADTAIVQTVLKDAARRVKPSRYPASGWFASQGPPASYIRGNGSFPSGHSMAAFSVATVIARRYRNHRWVPYAAYGLASLVGFSRLTLNVHFLSDICMGGAIGYSISRFTVLRQ